MQKLKMDENILEIKQGKYYVRIPRDRFSKKIIESILDVFKNLDANAKKGVQKP